MNLRSIVRKFLNKIDLIIIKFSSKNMFLSNLYYLLFSKAFSREHQSVLVGKLKHIDEVNNKKGNNYQLVRNIHRIEKGLLMRPRRPVFAKSYIAETIELFEVEWINSVNSNIQIQWFHDVLNEYFKNCASDEIIDKQADKFYSLLNGRQFIPNEEHFKKPYRRETVEKTDISFDELYQLTRQRRSVRWFSDKDVSRELIDKAILAANQSPSACNRQPFEYRIIDEPELLSKVVNVPMGTRGYAENIPVMIVCVGNLDAYFSERDRHLIYIDASLANMSLMLALETLGLSSCPINWPDIEAKEKEMAKLLGLGMHQRPIMCIGLGYADPKGKIAFSEKRGLESIRTYN
ncbi:MAG: nitroreductase family protein [Balneolaceae bacterium]